MKKLGFGTMKLPLACESCSEMQEQKRIDEMSDLFLSQGFLFFDTASGSKQEDIEIHMSRSLVMRYPRNRFCLADHMPLERIFSDLDYEPFFQSQMERWNVDYFDFYSLNPLNFCTFPDTVEYGGFAFLSRLKEEGRARRIGFSFDGKPELLDHILSDHPEMDYVQLNLNYRDWYDESHPIRSCYETALRHHRPVIVIDFLKGNSLSRLPASAHETLCQLHPDWTPQAWALRFASSLPHVPVVLCQPSDADELQIHLDTLTDQPSLTDEEQAVLKIAAGF